MTTVISERPTAADDMASQEGAAEGSAYNLEHIWRACGSPRGRDPRSWSSGGLAGWFISGTAIYFANRERAAGIRAEDRSEGVVEDVFFDLTSNPKPEFDWRVGDKLGTRVIARAYTEYLDESDGQG